MKEFGDYIEEVCRTGKKIEIPKDVADRFHARVAAKAGPKIEEHRRQQRIGWARMRDIVVD